MLTSNLYCISRKTEVNILPRGEEDEEKRQEKLDRRYASGGDARCLSLKSCHTWN